MPRGGVALSPALEFGEDACTAPIPLLFWTTRVGAMLSNRAEFAAHVLSVE